jgi:hypothetical protein
MTENMLKTKWQKPVAMVGGINYLISKYVQNKYYFDDEYHVNIIVHSYREVGTSLEAAIEVHLWCLNSSNKPECKVELRNIVI